MARKQRKSETKTADNTRTRNPSVPLDTNFEVLPDKSASINGTLLFQVKPCPRFRADSRRMLPKAERSQGKSENA